MSALPAPLLKQLRQTLLDCGPFDSDRQLRAIFTADARLAPWRNNLPEADSRAERVNLFVAEFLRRRNRQEQSVLVLFLQAVHEQAEEEDECHQRLNDLAVQVAAATGSALPPLARNNLWRAAATQTEDILPTALPGYVLPPVEVEPALRREPLPTGLAAGAFAERLESLKNKAKADWLPVDFLEKGLQAAYAVGRVEHHGRRIGTAFLVAPDLVLTNAHVMAEIPTLTEGGVRFHVGLQTEPAWCYFARELIASPVQELDFALLQLQTAVPNARPISFSSEKAYPDQPANMLQYPGMAGGMMQVALRYNAIVHVGPTRLYYVTDTEEGSSGSPVFNDAWRVIGLHRAGMVDDAQRPVKGANQGVPITAVAPLIATYLG
jgi:hypothetical protein